jgi:hypothetical protein
MPEASSSKSLNRERTVLDLHRDKETHFDKDQPDTSDPTHKCPGCRRPAVGSKGGLVIACGKFFFHVDCYKCKKCQDSIEINDRVFLDFDGLPLCEHCFHKCTSCKLSISDSKIVYVNNNSYYHPACFLCKRCSQVLDEKRFAKTKQSIYCTDCYKKRLAKSKRKAEKKVERETHRNTPPRA